MFVSIKNGKRKLSVEEKIKEFEEIYNNIIIKDEKTIKAHEKNIIDIINHNRYKCDGFCSRCVFDSRHYNLKNMDIVDCDCCSIKGFFFSDTRESITATNFKRLLYGYLEIVNRSTDIEFEF